MGRAEVVDGVETDTGLVDMGRAGVNGLHRGTDKTEVD